MNELISFKEFRQRISIIDLALGNGYALDKKKGRKWPVLKNVALNDAIIIINPSDPSNQGYFNPNNDKDKGTLFNFIRNRFGSIFSKVDNSDIKNINAVLYNWLNMDHPVKQEYNYIAPKQAFTVSFLESFSNADYLLSRHLSRKIIFSGEFKNRIFNQVYVSFINTCFPYYNALGEIVACEIRNTNYKMQSDGSDRSTGIWHSNIPLLTEHVILTESPIDAISYRQLKGKENSLYVSFGGGIAAGQINTLQKILEKLVKSDALKIISGFDNDQQGEKYYNTIKGIFPALIKDHPLSKDYNKDLSNLYESSAVACIKINVKNKTKL